MGAKVKSSEKEQQRLQEALRQQEAQSLKSAKIAEELAKERYSTGAQRDTREGKGRYDLLQTVGIHRVAQVCERGAKTYGGRNWQQGIPLSRYLDSALRHTNQYLEGYRDEDHLAHACWNLLSAMWTETVIERGLLPDTLNDLPSFVGVSDEHNTGEVPRNA